MKLFLLTLLVILSAKDVSALTPNDFLIAEQWYLEKIHAFEAWETATGDSAVVVAVLDSGVDLNHQDLADRLWENTGEVIDGADNDNNGFDDDIAGWDFVDGDARPAPELFGPFSAEAVSHGTLIAGIIGATTNNGLGVAGLSWDVRIMPLRVLDDFGVGSSDAVRKAIRYAVENGADVINLSFTTLQYDGKLVETIRWAHEQGTVVVAAMGNTEAGGVDVETSAIYPACLDAALGTDIVIGVTATNTRDEKAYFSNFGSSCADISAPGVDIFGLVYMDERERELQTSYGGPWQGTSTAAAMVSGAAALVRSAYPSLTPEKVQLALQLSVDPLREQDTVVKRAMGSGRLNVARALEVAREFSGSSVISARRDVTPSGSFVVAEGSGSAPVVRRFDARGILLAEFLAYDEAFDGGVRLAMGDVNGDGVEEIVTGAGPHGGPQVRVFDLEGNVRNQFFAFDEESRTGIFVAMGDTNADGVDEIIVTQDAGGYGQARIFDRAGNLLGAFYPFDRTDAGLQTTVGNFDDDAGDEIAFVLDTYNPLIRLFNGTGTFVRDFQLVTGDTHGVSLSAGDLDGDLIDEIVVGYGPNSQPYFSVYNATGELQKTASAFADYFGGGVNVAVGDIDQNGQVEIYAAPQADGGPHLRIFDDQGQVIGEFFGFDSNDRFGADVAIWGL